MMMMMTSTTTRMSTLMTTTSTKTKRRKRRSINCHTVSEPQARPDLNVGVKDNDKDVINKDDINEDNKLGLILMMMRRRRRRTIQNYFFQKYLVSYLFEITSLA